MNSIKPIKKEKEFKVSELKLPFKGNRQDILKTSNSTRQSLEHDDDDETSDLDTKRSEASKVNTNRNDIIVPQFKYITTDANDVIEQHLPFLCFSESENENVNIYGVDVGGYSIAISHYCSKNKNIINFNNSGRNSLYIEKYGLKTEIFLPQLVITDILGMSITEAKDVIKSYYSFPGCDVDAMESDVYRLQLFVLNIITYFYLFFMLYKLDAKIRSSYCLFSRTVISFIII